MNKTVFAFFVMACGLGFAATPTISGIAVSTDTNAVVVKYVVSPQAPYTVTGATWSGGSATFSLGPHSIEVNDVVTVSGIVSANPVLTTGFNNDTLNYPGYQVTSVSPTTITVYGPAYNPGTWTSGGTVTVAPFCWVQYGVVSGTYLWSSYTYNLAEYPTSYSSSCSVPITGLQDGATYYFLPTARPHADDEKEVCNTSSCGAVEQRAVTPAASVSHLPEQPASVAASLLSEPDITGYVTIPLVDGGLKLGHECVAAPGTYTAPSGYPTGTPTVSAGQTLTSIIASGAMLYGMIFQIPQGVNCAVPSTSWAYGSGYAFPVLAPDPIAGGSIDADNHRWIIFRTAPGGSGDFPPFGTRTGPSFFSHYGGFQSHNPSVYSAFGTGTIFAENTGLTHHLWFENLKFSVDETLTNANYAYLFFLGSGESGGSPPFPKYIVFRGNYFHGPNRADIKTGTPSIQGAIAGTLQGQVAIVGNYFDNLYFAGGALGAGIVQGIYFQDCGNSGTCGTGGPVLIDNNYLHGMAMNLYVEQTNFAHATAHDFTVTHNYLYYPYETFTWASNQTDFPYGYACRNQIEFKGMSKALISGNYINGAWACANSGTPLLFAGWNADLTIKSNVVTNAPSLFALAGLIPHEAGAVSGTGNRYWITNNLGYNLSRKIPGDFQAGGGSLAASVLEIDSAVNNIRMVNNTVGPILDGDWYSPYIFENAGGSTGQIAGMTMQNNIFPFGLSATPSSGGIGVLINGVEGPGVLSHPATPGINYQTYPVTFKAWLDMNNGYTASTPNLGLQGVSVVAGGSGYPNTGPLIFGGCSTPPVGVFNAINGVIRSTVDPASGNPVPATWMTSFGSGCDPATMTVTADTSKGGSGASLRPHYGLTPSSLWSGNVNVCTNYLGVEMSEATCLSLGSTMPATDKFSPGDHLADRLAAAGISANYAVVPTAANPGNAGANLNRIYADTGTVDGVTLAVSSAAVQVSYSAPDSRACSLDLSTDAGATWSRTTDTGGGPRRALKVTGLRTGTNYNYRVLCYFDQTSDLFAGSQVTNGTFSTLTPKTSNLSFVFALPAVRGATSFKVSLTAIDGTQFSNTCTTSPCVVINVPVGDYSSVQRWTSGTNILATSDAQTVLVR